MRESDPSTPPFERPSRGRILVAALLLLGWVLPGCNTDYRGTVVAALARGDFAAVREASLRRAEHFPAEALPRWLERTGRFMGDDQVGILPPAPAAGPGDLSTLKEFAAAVASPGDMGTPTLWNEFVSALVEDLAGANTQAAERYARAAAAGGPEAIKGCEVVARHLAAGWTLQRELAVEMAGSFALAGGDPDWIVPDAESKATGKVISRLGTTTYEARVQGALPFKNDRGERIGWGVCGVAGTVILSAEEYAQILRSSWAAPEGSSFVAHSLDLLGRFVRLDLSPAQNHCVLLVVQLHADVEEGKPTPWPAFPDMNLQGGMYRTGDGLAGVMRDKQGRPRVFGSSVLRYTVESGRITGAAMPLFRAPIDATSRKG